MYDSARPLRHSITPVWHGLVMCTCSQFATARWKFGTWLQRIGTNIQTIPFFPFARVQIDMNYRKSMETNLHIPYPVTLVLPVQTFLQCGNSIKHVLHQFSEPCWPPGRMPQMRSRIAKRMIRFHHGITSRADLDYEKTIDTITCSFLRHGEVLHLDV